VNALESRLDDFMRKLNLRYYVIHMVCMNLKEASNLIDQKQALLSLPTPQAGNAEHPLDIESSRTRKSLVKDTEDLQARWQQFLENHEEDVCMVIFTLKFGCPRTHYAQEFQNVGWEAFQILNVDEVPGLK
jgi:hypothetical protein